MNIVSWFIPFFWVVVSDSLIIFDNIDGQRDLKLLSVTPYASGAVLLYYGVSSAL